MSAWQIIAATAPVWLAAATWLGMRADARTTRLDARRQRAS